MLMIVINLDHAVISTDLIGLQPPKYFS
jgi:hypothetical protein